MAIDNKYGKIDVPGKPHDLPAFIIFADDWVSKKLIEVYREMCAQAGSPQEHLDGIQAAWERFHEWRAANDPAIHVPGTDRHPEAEAEAGIG